jgi:hypothetical protein
MSEHHPEMDPAATFRLDQEAAAAEEENRHQTIWSHQVRDAETTMDQREAITRMVNAKASFLETVETLVWIATGGGVVFGLAWSVQRLIEAVR